LPITQPQALYLQLQPTDKTQGTIVVDGMQGTLGFRRHPGRLLHEPLIKAVGDNKNYQPSVIDATAGWGTDAFLLASFGCRMTLIEADPLIAVLLADGLRRWQEGHMDLMLGQAIDIIPALAKADFPDVIYLDPMFPIRQKTALVKKNMAFLQQWLGEVADLNAETLLLDTARRHAKKRVVVKRPQSATYLAGIKPSGAVSTRHHRYDIYAPA
jgi:16S rRNA (guanine1516-N2)-methyltransferase